MPLHRKCKPLHIVDSISLNKPVISDCFGTHAVRKSCYGLRMQRVDVERVRTHKSTQQTALGKADRMRWPILHIQGIVLVLEMIVVTGYLVHFLVQGPAQCDIEFLESTANSQ